MIAEDGTSGISAHARVFRVLRTLHGLGPGMHPLHRITDEAGCTKSTVHRILRAGVDEEHLVYQRSRYGISSDLSGAHSDSVVSLMLAPDSALERETVHLQRQTAQVALAYTPVLIDNSPGRLLLHRGIGRRSDFQSSLNHASPEARDALRYSALHTDAAGLVILAHLDGAPESHLMREIRSEGYVLTPSPLPGWEMLAAPLWRRNQVTGVLAIMGLRAQMQRNRREYAAATLAAATRLSHRCELASGALRLAS